MRSAAEVLGSADQTLAFDCSCRHAHSEHRDSCSWSPPANLPRPTSRQRHHFPMTQVAAELRVSQACEDGKRFAELFYEKLDKNRSVINGLFMDEAKLVWNGNLVEGKPRIVDFYAGLPISETQLNSVDAQPVLDLPALQGQPTINVACAGRIRFGPKSKFFMECFTLTALNNTWKIVSDTFRDYT